MNKTETQQVLDALNDKLGNPPYFWPLVMFFLFIVLPCTASVFDGV